MSGVVTGYYPCQKAEDRSATGLTAVQGANSLNNDAHINLFSLSR